MVCAWINGCSGAGANATRFFDSLGAGAVLPRRFAVGGEVFPAGR